MLVQTVVERLRDFFTSRETEVYLVGGAVRDLLVGARTGDVDITTGALEVYEELAQAMGGHAVWMDEDREVVRVIVPSALGFSHVDISRMRGAIGQDLAMRDFTVDAMALPVSRDAADDPCRHLIDPLGGLADLRARTIRQASTSVFRDDPARLLRAPRLAAQLDFEIDQETEARIRADSHLISGVASERVRDELLKILAQDGATRSLRLLDRLDLLCRVIPELEAAKGVGQPKEHHWDVFGHLIEAVGQVEALLGGHSETPEFVEKSALRFEGIESYFTQPVGDSHTRLTLLKLAALLHDVAKPATKSVEPSGRIRFLGHSEEGADIAAAVLRRLRVSSHTVELVRKMVRHHLRPAQMAPAGEVPSGRAVFRYYRDLGDAAIDTLYLSLADHLAARGPDLEPEEWARQCHVVSHILGEGRDRSAPEAMPRLLNGHDLMTVFSLSPGPRIGILLNVVQEAQASGDIDTREEAIELVRSRLESGGAGA